MFCQADLRLCSYHWWLISCWCSQTTLHMPLWLEQGAGVGKSKEVEVWRDVPTGSSEVKGNRHKSTWRTLRSLGHVPDRWNAGKRRSSLCKQVGISGEKQQDRFDRSESSDVVWFRNNYTEAKTGATAWKIKLLLWEGPGWTESGGEDIRGTAHCSEEGQWMDGWKDAEVGPGRQKVWRRSREEIHGCSEKRTWSQLMWAKRTLTADDWPWRFKRVAAQRKRRGWSIWS